ncbi:Hypothetical predicted protein [Octopus vulgaris]|uniref:Uncharacterized protein n=1 Tax=Octopus vulgaris TaxID=6645 RepID=A0AA36FI62_OCTVU|nr:Hypothetical predicted protein [Octopus vulgaris]
MDVSCIAVTSVSISDILIKNANRYTFLELRNQLFWIQHGIADILHFGFTLLPQRILPLHIVYGVSIVAEMPTNYNWNILPGLFYRESPNHDNDCVLRKSPSSHR